MGFAATFSRFSGVFGTTPPTTALRKALQRRADLSARCIDSGYDVTGPAAGLHDDVAADIRIAVRQNAGTIDPAILFCRSRASDVNDRIGSYTRQDHCRSSASDIRDPATHDASPYAKAIGP
jgi:hypothetical protein